MDRTSWCARLAVTQALGGMLLAVGTAIAAPVAAQQALDLQLNEQVVTVPVEAADGQQWSLIATTYHPPGDGPFPLVVLNHGSPGVASQRALMGRYRHMPQIREFIRRGFAVIVPMRRGYGATGGAWIENFGSCAAPHYYRAALASGQDVLAATQFAQALPFVKADAVILVGYSAGGIAALAAASAEPPGVIAVVNISGGRGGRPYTDPGEPCVAEDMTIAIGKLARTIRVPVLWHYVENDRFFAPRHVREWFRAFRNAGGTGRLVMQPPFQLDGHSLFGAVRGLPIWTSALDRFLEDIHFSSSATQAVATPAVHRSAAPAVPASLPSAARTAPAM